MLEDPAFVVLADEGLVVDVVELVVVLLRLYNFQLGDVLKRGREGLVAVDVLLEVLPVLLLVVADVHDQDVTVDLALPQGELLVALLELLHLLAAPTQLKHFLLLALTRTLGRKQPLSPAGQLDQQLALGLWLSVQEVAQEDSGAAETAAGLLFFFLLDLEPLPNVFVDALERSLARN